MGTSSPSFQDSVVHFEGITLNLNTGELSRDGAILRLPPKPTKILAVLVRHAGEVVAREDIVREIWGADTFVDFDQGLNYSIRLIRVALQDNAEQPRFIETLPKRGYRFIAPLEPEPQEAGSTVKMDHRAETEPEIPTVGVKTVRTRQLWFWRNLILVCSVVAVLTLVYVLRPTMPVPHVDAIEQITKTGAAWHLEPLLTDGARLYYRANDGRGWQFRQVVLNGNEDQIIDSQTLPALRIKTLSTDGAEFLALSHIKDDEWAAQTIPVSGGPPRRLGNLIAYDLAASHDGTRLAYSHDNQLFLASPDGTGSRSLVTVQGGVLTSGGPQTIAGFASLWSVLPANKRYGKLTPMDNAYISSVSAGGVTWLSVAVNGLRTDATMCSKYVAKAPPSCG